MNECSELYKGTAASMGNANTVEDTFREKLEDKSAEAEIENRQKADWKSAALRQFVRENCLPVPISVVMHRLYLVLEILSFALHYILACENLYLNCKVNQSCWKEALQNRVEVTDMFKSALKYSPLIFSKLTLKSRFQWLYSLCRRAMENKG